MFKSVAAFELRYQLKQPLLWLIAVIFGLLAFAAISSDAVVIGGAIGLAAAWWLGVQFEPVFRQYLPGFQVPRDAIAMGVVYMFALGLVAGAVPAAQAMRLRIVEALRRD